MTARAVGPVVTRPLVNVRTNRSRTARLARSAVWHASVTGPAGCAQVRVAPVATLLVLARLARRPGRRGAGCHLVRPSAHDSLVRSSAAPIVAARDRDPRTPAEAIARSPRRARARAATTRRPPAATRRPRPPPADHGGRGTRPPRATVRPGRPQGGRRRRRRRRRRSPTRRTSRRPSRAARSRSGRWPRSACCRSGLFMYVRSLTEPPEVAAGPARRRRRGLRRLRQLPRRRRRGRRRPPVHRRRGRCRRSRTSRTSCASSTSAPSEYNIAGVDELRQPRPRGRPAPHRLARRRCRRRAPTPAAS